MSNLPDQTAPRYATDENLAVAAGADYANLCPASQIMAQGLDGVFANGAPWVLASATVDFAAYGVQPNHVVRLTAPGGSFKGTGQMLAVDSVAAGSITLRRLHKDLAEGMPPAPSAGLTSVAFLIQTFDPQIEEASFALKRRFSIDETIFYRSSTWIYDLRELRMATVWTVLCDRYSQEARTNAGDFPMKYARAKQKLSEVIEQVSVRWGDQGNAQEPTTVFSCKTYR